MIGAHAQCPDYVLWCSKVPSRPSFAGGVAKPESDPLATGVTIIITLFVVPVT